MTTRSLLLAAGLCCVGASAQAASLSTLISGGSLTAGDVVFSAFSFQDESDIQTYPNDTPVDASSISVDATTTTDSATLSFTIDPSLAIGGDEGFFEFLLDFSASVASPSTRSIFEVTLGGGDLDATNQGIAEVVYEEVGSDRGDLEIFEDPSGSQASQTFDSISGFTVQSLVLEGIIEGETGVGDTAGLSMFSLTFKLEGTPPPHTPIPLPPSALLMLSALSGLTWVGLRGKA